MLDVLHLLYLTNAIVQSSAIYKNKHIFGSLIEDKHFLSCVCSSFAKIEVTILAAKTQSWDLPALNWVFAFNHIGICGTCERLKIF